MSLYSTIKYLTRCHTALEFQEVTAIWSSFRNLVATSPPLGEVAMKNSDDILCTWWLLSSTIEILYLYIFLQFHLLGSEQWKLVLLPIEGQVLDGGGVQAGNVLPLLLLHAPDAVQADGQAKAACGRGSLRGWIYRSLALRWKWHWGKTIQKNLAYDNYSTRCQIQWRN